MKKAERAASPFPSIPDVALESELLETDIVKVQEKKPISPLRPVSPFPAITDVSLNPEVLEKDIVLLRTSPQTFQQVSDLTKTEEISEKMVDAKEEESAPLPFPTIPNITKYLAQNPESFIKPIPLKKYEPIFLDKKYNLNNVAPKQLTSSLRPEFRYALPNLEQKVVEHKFDSPTPDNFRTVQSEMFESQGHFNASRSCSPFPVYVPKAEQPVCENKEVSESPKQIIVVKEVVQELKDPKHEEHMKKLALSINKEKSEVMESQKHCFSELQEIQSAYAESDKQLLEMMAQSQTQLKQEDNEITKILQMKKTREGQIIIESETESKVETVDFTTKSEEMSVEQKESVSIISSVDVQPEVQNQNVSIAEENVVTSVDDTLQEKDNISETKKVEETTEKFSSETQRRKKPPETISGARPIFGQLDINSEFQKAFSGRQKSLQDRKVEKSTGLQPKLKMEKTENVMEEKLTNQSKLATQFINNEVASVETYHPSKNDEIEKIYYQQEREFHVDYQTTQEEIIYPDNSEKYSVSASNENNFVQQLAEVKSNLHHSQVETVESYDTNKEIETYQKIPVKSLIKNFEQSAMPVLRYKQIREPSPNVVEMLSKKTDKRSTTNQEEYLKVAEQEFDNLYYVANSKVETKYYPLEQPKSLVQSENSSFCKYTSQKSQYQASATSEETTTANGEGKRNVTLLSGLFFLLYPLLYNSIVI